MPGQGRVVWPGVAREATCGRQSTREIIFFAAKTGSALDLERSGILECNKKNKKGEKTEYNIFA